MLCLDSVLFSIAAAQNKTPFKKEPNLEQWNEKFMLDNTGAAWKENLSENGSKSSRRELRSCSILSPEPAVTATDPAAKVLGTGGETSELKQRISSFSISNPAKHFMN